jgi:hypothetical protein
VGTPSTVAEQKTTIMHWINKAETDNRNRGYNKNLGIHVPRKRGGGMASTSRARRRPVKSDVTEKNHFAAARLDDQWMLAVCGRAR